MAKYQFRDQLRLSDAAREELLDGMDADAREEHALVFESGRNNRTDRRYECRRDRVPFIVKHPGGGHACLYVPLRNLSSRGLAVLHSQFLYKDSRTRILLTCVDGHREPIDGVIVNVRHVRKSVHEVNVRFDHAIDVSRFLTPAELRGERPDEPAPLSTVEGSVLYGDTDANDRKAFLHCVSRSRVQPTVIAKPGAAIDSVKLGRFDVLIIDLHLLEKDGVSVIHDLRQAGHHGPLVITGDTRAPMQHFADAMAAGATHLMRKPFEAAELLRFLRDRIEESRALQGLALSDLDSADHLFKLAARMGDALEETDAEAIRQLCRSVAESATRGGHASLHKAADHLLRSLSRIESPEELEAEVRRVIDQCRLIGESI